MILASVFSSLLLASYVSAAPAAAGTLRLPPADPKALLCKLPFINKRLCPRKGSDSSPSVETVLGTATGTEDSGANRYAVQYATAGRWQASELATSWELPNGASDPTLMPLACPQSNLDPSLYSEDCLSMVLYVPANLPKTLIGIPTLVWIPGGSFIMGGASDTGLDGSKLAIATNSIVAVIQHRLGAFGFMAPDGTVNLGVKDVMNALQFLKITVPAFGGNPLKITLAGQSSGANMIRALLATPSASGLFKSGILHSDPMDYGFQSTSIQTNLLNVFNSFFTCAPSDSACLNNLSLDSILYAQGWVFNNSLSIDPASAPGEPLRPVRDGVLITSPLDSTAKFPSVNKPLMISSVKNDAGPAIYGPNAAPLPEVDFVLACNGSLGPVRANTIIQSPFYRGLAVDGSIDARQQLEKLGTDYIWKCAAWTFARNWVGNGGTAFVGLYTLGATYPDNEGVPFCLEDGVVCHEDDIQIVFGTTPNPTPAQSALTTEVQQRYKAFLTSGNPNVNGLATWTPATTSDVHAHNLGGTTAIPVGACDPSFWGNAVQYDYQLFGI